MPQEPPVNTPMQAPPYNPAGIDPNTVGAAYPDPGPPPPEQGPPLGPMQENPGMQVGGMDPQQWLRMYRGGLGGMGQGLPPV